MIPQKISPSEYELHYHRLLLRRQIERRHGIMLIIAGLVYFILILICSLPLFFLHSMGLVLIVACIVGMLIALFFVFSGVVSLRSSRLPVTSREVYRWRSIARIALYRQAQGELPPDYTFRGRIKRLLIGSMITLSSSSVLWLLLNSTPGLLWVRNFLGVVVLLLELLLILETFYLRAREIRNLPAQSAQDLSLLLATGELTTGEVPDRQTFGDNDSRVMRQ